MPDETNKATPSESYLPATVTRADSHPEDSAHDSGHVRTVVTGRVTGILSVRVITSAPPNKPTSTSR